LAEQRSGRAATALSGSSSSTGAERGGELSEPGVSQAIELAERRHPEAMLAEAALRESEDRFRNMADAAPVMIWVSGSDKKCTFFNKGWLAFTGRTMGQELGDGWAYGVHPDDLKQCFSTYCSSFDAREPFQMEYRLRRLDGEFRWVLDRGVPRFDPAGGFAGYIGSAVDVTDVKRSQEKALAKQKLESLGVLAGGIAHDFNNLLGSILAETELALSDAATVQSERHLRKIRNVSVRAAEIVRELMTFAGGESSAFERVDVSRLVQEMVELLKVSISKRVILKVNLGDNLPPVDGNAAQLGRVVMNLITNAAEAIGEDCGAITLTTAVVPVTGSAGASVCLEVADTGCGMTETIQDSIFDPFFTTKFAGRGLGLAVVQGIVRSHGGSIHVCSVPGEGTAFQVVLPGAARASAPAEAHHTTRTAAPARPAARHATILVVDDEETLRMAVSKMLHKRGFTALEAGDGQSAMDLMSAHRDELDVILLDLTIPVRASSEVLDAARRDCPGAKVILTTAYSREMATASFGGTPVDGFIRKPYEIAELLRLLEEIEPR
jgi:two-component system, cell cycle sensor histidine kinase and response regulator CckA